MSGLTAAGFGGIFTYIARLSNGAPDPMLSEWWFEKVDFAAHAV